MNLNFYVWSFCQCTAAPKVTYILVHVAKQLLFVNRLRAGNGCRLMKHSNGIISRSLLPETYVSSSLFAIL